MSNKASATADANFWKDQSFKKDEELRLRDQVLANNLAALNGTQKSLTELSIKVLEIGKPTPAKYNWNESDDDPRPQSGQIVSLLVLTTNKVVPAPVRIIINCPREIFDRVDWRTAGKGMYGDAVLLDSGHTAFIQMELPLWSPQMPMLARAYSRKKMTTCTMEVK